MTLAAIKSAIENLAEKEKSALLDWLLRADRVNWDKQMSKDFSSGGPGMKVLDEVDAAIDRGDFKPLG
jgi:hypothetical protein